MIRRRDGGSLALAWSLDGPILSSRRGFHTQRDVAAFADEQIEALRNANQSAERDGVRVQNRRRTAWCDLLTRAVERNAGEVAGAHANRAIFTHFGAWGGDGDGLGHPFERLAAHIVERVEEAREIRRRAGDGSSRAATPDPEPTPASERRNASPRRSARELATKILPEKAPSDRAARCRGGVRRRRRARICEPRGSGRFTSRETKSVPRVRDAPPATAFTDAYAFISPEKEPPPTIRRPSVPPPARRHGRRVRFADDVADHGARNREAGESGARYQVPGRHRVGTRSGASRGVVSPSWTSRGCEERGEPGGKTSATGKIRLTLPPVPTPPGGGR